MKRRGATLIEVLVVGIVITVVSGAVLAGFLSLTGSYNSATSAPPVQSDAANAVNDIAKAIRGASLSPGNTAVATASANTITVYNSSSGSTTQYQVLGGALQKNLSGTTTTLAQPTATLTLSYCVLPTGYYYSPNDLGSLTWSSSVSGTSLQNIAAVSVSVSITRGAVTSNYSSIVRLRNSPKKSYPF